MMAVPNRRNARCRRKAAASLARISGNDCPKAESYFMSTANASADFQISREFALVVRRQCGQTMISLRLIATGRSRALIAAQQGAASRRLGKAHDDRPVSHCRSERACDVEDAGVAMMCVQLEARPRRLSFPREADVSGQGS
jgi:hypothetical protein